jgi:S-adenosylmethionine:tRNA ribosyltransferase-isomerase
MTHLSDYDYDLPEELIAQDPLEDRAASRLLWLHNGKADDKPGTVTHHKFREITNILKAGDLLVMNNTRVTALRIMGKKDTGAKVEALLLQEGANKGEFVALTFPARKLKVGTPIFF